LLSRLSDETDSNARTVAGSKVNPKKGGAMELFQRMRRLDVLRAEDRTEKQKHGDWMRSLDKEDQDAFEAQVLAFQKEELAPELNYLMGLEDMEKELSDLSEGVQAVVRSAIRLALDATLSYMDALYLADLAWEALAPLQEPPDEP